LFPAIEFEMWVPQEQKKSINAILRKISTCEAKYVARPFIYSLWQSKISIYFMHFVNSVKEKSTKVKKT